MAADGLFGTCMTMSECEEGEGTADGNCAAGEVYVCLWKINFIEVMISRNSTISIRLKNVCKTRYVQKCLTFQVSVSAAFSQLRLAEVPSTRTALTFRLFVAML